MSTATTQPPSDHQEPNFALMATANPERARVALEAAWEIEALATALIEIASKGGEEPSDHFRIRAFGVRIRELSGAAMLSLDHGEHDDIAELRARVTGLN